LIGYWRSLDLLKGSDGAVLLVENALNAAEIASAITADARMDVVRH